MEGGRSHTNTNSCITKAGGRATESEERTVAASPQGSLIVILKDNTRATWLFRQFEAKSHTDCLESETSTPLPSQTTDINMRTQCRPAFATTATRPHTRPYSLRWVTSQLGLHTYDTGWTVRRTKPPLHQCLSLIHTARLHTHTPGLKMSIQQQAQRSPGIPFPESRWSQVL